MEERQKQIERGDTERGTEGHEQRKRWLSVETHRMKHKMIALHPVLTAINIALLNPRLVDFAPSPLSA